MMYMKVRSNVQHVHTDNYSWLLYQGNDHNVALQIDYVQQYINSKIVTKRFRIKET